METRFIIVELLSNRKEDRDEFIEVNLQAEFQIKSLNRKENFARTYAIRKVYFR